MELHYYRMLISLFICGKINVPFTARNSAVTETSVCERGERRWNLSQ